MTKKECIKCKNYWWYSLLFFCVGVAAGSQYGLFSHVPRFFQDKNCDEHCTEEEKNSPYPKPRPQNPWERKDKPPTGNNNNQTRTQQNENKKQIAR